MKAPPWRHAGDFKAWRVVWAGSEDQNRDGADRGRALEEAGPWAMGSSLPSAPCDRWRSEHQVEK